jgi:release factor glutamine methyltransferase
MSDFGKVYEPSDDTYLLIDGIQCDLGENPSIAMSARTILELGSGNGIPITFCSKLVPSALSIATDINPNALAFTKKTAVENRVTKLETIQCDLATPLLVSCKQRIDIIIFNPPYVPTPNDEVSGNGIEVSWAGGERGRLVVDRAIPQIAHLLSENGVCYMITVDDNEPEEIAQMFDALGIKMFPLVRRRAYNEYLSVQKLMRKKETKTQEEGEENNNR